MDYEIKMPILSDTMERGKLIKWHVDEGDRVKKGDVIAEVESDKAIMEVQTFKDGVVKKILAKEGEEIPIKEPIAIIETKEISEKKESKKEAEKKVKKEKETPEILKEIETIVKEPKKEIEKPIKGIASAAAKKIAQKEKIDIEKLQKEGMLPKPAHLKDIEEEILKRYFTPKAIKLIKDYNIDISLFKKERKIKEDEILEFIKKENIPKKVEISANKKVVIENVIRSSQKPTFHIYETFDFKRDKRFKLTSILLKKIGDVMQKHPLTRAKLNGSFYDIYPHSNISVAVAKEDELYMVVCKNIEEKSIEEIDKWLREVKSRKYGPDELRGSTFGISNLGMFGIKSFDALINRDDSGIVAFGKYENSKIEAVFTFDHRIINGLEAVLFVKDLKEEFMSV